MSILFLVLPLAIIIAGAAVAAYVWSARAGQFDDLDTPAVRMLYDDDITTGSATPPTERGKRPGVPAGRGRSRAP